MGKILIIDDDSELRSLWKELLQQSGWQVAEAEDGQAGIQAARELRPDVVLCDLLMPRCNGFQVCRTLRADPLLRHVRIVVTTGRSYVTDRLHAIESGADKYLIKPITAEELRRALHTLESDAGVAESSEETVPPSVETAPMVRFWGVRGSIPTPGPSTIFYGGNTSCVEVRVDGEVIIFDAGSGIRGCGLQLNKDFKDQPLNLTLLLTHTHWDHIQGFPFFMPAYNPRNHLRILGYEGATHGLAETLSGQMESPYFPIGLEEVPANIQIEELKEMEFTIGRVQGRSWFVNHPGICAGYRLETSAGSVVFIPDVEPFHRLRSQPNPADPGVQSSIEFARHEDTRLEAFIRGADVLIMDSQYDVPEYQAHIGWGHACVDDVVHLAVRAGAGQLYLFHHDPSHDDETISRFVAHARQVADSLGATMVVEAAREGLEVRLPIRRGEGAGPIKTARKP